MRKPGNILSAIGFAAVVALAGGCVHYQPKPLSPAATMAGLESRSLSDEGLREFLEANDSSGAQEWPRRSWDLRGLTLAAFYYHPSLDVVRAQVGVAEAGVITAGGRPNPSVSLSPEYTINPDTGLSPWLFGVNFDIPIETA